ncbi:uncharacterized protein LOC123918914 [Trifolium pratense]|uniref:uncharacterized protein LOC123918914 n=1 Tax=Trifolium pratense TaxID=57577 RepID=UPI001E692DAE|nr:uncharacterized protein LOC123918914 [Trifolium pratense]
MIAIGYNDPREYPTTIDTIEGRTLAVRVKWQPKWSNGSVQGVHDGENFIEDLKAQFTSAQDPKPLEQVPSPFTEEITSSEAVESNREADYLIPTVSLSDTDEIDPNLLTMNTPSKRTGADLKDDNIEAADFIGSKLSSTKMPKHPKME